MVDFLNEQRIPIEASKRDKGHYPYYGATGIIDYVKDYIFEGEYVLLAEDGANITMRNSPIAYLTEGKFWVNNHAHIMKMTSGSNIFLVQLLDRQNYEKYNSGTAQPKLNGSVVKNIKLDFPSNKEQNQIGSFFEQLDNTIALHQRKLELLKQLKQGYLQNMFPQQGESMPKLRFADFDSVWEQRKLGEVLKVNSGRDYKHLQTGPIPVYGTGGYMLSVNESLSNIDAVGIGRKGTIDKPRLLRAPFWTVDTLFYMTTKGNHDLFFCYSLANNIHWKRYEESTGVPSLSKSSIDKITINIPELKLQIKIGILFKQLDNTIALHQTKLEKVQSLKKAYLQKMFI